MTNLKKIVYEQNMELFRRGLVVYTWGNVSQIDREKGVFLIKPSGVPYENMKPEDMVAVDLDGSVVNGDLRPSSDMATHLALYKAFSQIGGVVHTHSRYATAWAQAGLSIPALGTTHADYFHGPVPITRSLSPEEINGDYEAETGNVIIETFGGINPLHLPSVLVKNHGPFSWGKDAAEAVHNAVVLEELAAMAYISKGINPLCQEAPQELLDKHFLRKHGENAYYGQRAKNK
ncbi:MAG: L-ribulose-5-phosphate 4-epimerase [Christensenellales bacterium]|jgi:L-ribulose-5-phosphate 4-epimerase